MQVTSNKTETPLRLWTVAEYHRMVETGILEENEPIELIAGQIITKMSPQGTLHAVTINLLPRLLQRCLGEQVLIRSQLPVTLNDYSEPEPDIALVIPDELRYLDHHPNPFEIFLIIEVAAYTLKQDCGLKAMTYGSSGIKDYWVLNLNQRQLHLFRDPHENGYTTEVILSEDETISPLKFPEVSLNVKDLFPTLQ